VDTLPFDSDEAGKNRTQTEKEVQSADAVLVIYDASRIQTFDRIGSFWLPWLQDTLQTKHVPIVLVGNKVDLTSDDVAEDRLQKHVMPIMNRFPEIETCVECSAKTLVNLSDTFRFAQMAVLHPIKPIFDAKTHSLKPKCTQAFKRIFKIVDRDKDGYLSDKELNQFQYYCFGLPLSPEELAGVKEVIQHQQPDGIDPEKGMTEAGFIYLHMLFVQRGRMETTWVVLRKYGYADDQDEVEFLPSYLLPEQYKTLDLPYELSNFALEYLTELFKSYQTRAQALGLTEKQLDELFSPAPNGNPWPATAWKTQTRAQDLMTLDSFLSMWNLMALDDHRKTLKYLAYLGFDSSITAPFKLYKNRRTRYKRNVVNVGVVGSPGVGKTTFLSRAVDHPLSAPKNDFLRVCTMVKDKSIASDHFVVLTEIPTHEAAKIFSDGKHPVAKQIDLVLMLFDASNAPSVQFIEERAEELVDSPLAVVFCGTHADHAVPALVDRMKNFTSKYGVPEAKYVSSSSIDDTMFGDLVRATISTTSHQIMSDDKRRKSRQSKLKLATVVAIGALAIVGGAVYFGGKYLNRDK